MSRFLSILVAVLATLALVGCEADWKKAEQYARGYAAKVPGSTGEVSCMKMDSDGDGYCRCNIFMLKAPPISVECGCERFCLLCKEGCGGIKPHLRNK
jgi:hypothetical protein